MTSMRYVLIIIPKHMCRVLWHIPFLSMYACNSCQNFLLQCNLENTYLQKKHCVTNSNTINIKAIALTIIDQEHPSLAEWEWEGI